MTNHFKKITIGLLLSLLTLTPSCGEYYDFADDNKESAKEPTGYFDFSDAQKESTHKPLGYFHFSDAKKKSKVKRLGYFYPPKPASPELEFSYFDTYCREPVHYGSPLSPQEIFPQPTTTHVWVELEVKNLLYKVRDQAYRLTFKYYQQDGRRLDSYTTTCCIKKDWEYAWYFDRWGWDSPGHWPLGTHYVEVWINDTKFATKKFTVAKDPAHQNPEKPFW